MIEPLRETALALSVDERIDQLELAICELPNLVDLEDEDHCEHVVTPGLYRRTLRCEAGVLATTYIHRQKHQFVVTRGVVRVSTGEGPAIEVRAPYFGVTEAGTRRICYVVEDAEWTCYWPIPEGMTELEEIERHIFELRTLPDGTNARDRFREALTARRLTERTG